MKTCRDIEALLPFYPEDALTKEEKYEVEQHLATCARCRKELACLQKAGQLVREMPEVSEPPWFRQKIMSEVRKEAEKKSLAQKWFYPLRIRIPLQIMATVVIAVLAVYIYRSGENQMKQVLPGVYPPTVEMQKDGGQPEMQKAPERNVTGASRLNVPLKKEAGRDKGDSEEVLQSGGLRKSVEPEKKPSSVYTADAQNARVSPDRKTDRYPEANHQPEGQISAKADVAPSVPVVPEEQKIAKDELSEREGQVAGSRMLSATKKEKKVKKNDAEILPAPAAPRSMAAAGSDGMKPAQLVLHVRDSGTAVSDIEKILVANGVKIMSRQILDGKTILQVMLSAGSRLKVMSSLKDVGQVHEKTKYSELNDQGGILILEIVPF